jgi:small subunit ribosomal protein S17
MSENARPSTTARRKGTTKVGVVVSDVMDKTVTVHVVTPTLHPFYHRIVRRTAKFMAHDPGNRCKTGDTVEITECRPLSKRKRWRVVRVVRAGTAAIGPLPVDELEGRA